MLFRTELKLEKSSVELHHGSQILLMGSCFSDNIGNLLQDSGMDVIVNPFGTVFNAVSIQKQMAFLLKKAVPSENLLGRNTSEHYSFHFDVHSTFKRSEESAVMDAIRQSINEFQVRGGALTHCFITLGTSWVYSKRDLKSIVANCHKMPQLIFEKKLLTIEENIDALTRMIKDLDSVYPNLQIIFTVSPVRHIKDGIVENSRSKAILIEAIHHVTGGNVHYFPAYEWMIDDLRDYRFYASDLIHPSEFAIQYIWEKFSEAYFNQNTKNIIHRIEQLNALKNHRMIDSGNSILVQKQEEKISILEHEIEKLLAK